MDGAEDDALYDDDSLEEVHEGKLLAVKLMMTLYQKKNSRRYLLAPMRVAYLKAFNNFLFFLISVIFFSVISVILFKTVFNLLMLVFIY